MELQKGEKRKDNDRVSIITSVKVDDTRVYIESC
jgi:hypothetical protein